MMPIKEKCHGTTTKKSVKNAIIKHITCTITENNYTSFHGDEKCHGKKVNLLLWQLTGSLPSQHITYKKNVM